MLPRADCTFNIPSLNDENQLDCRLYFPRVWSSTSRVAVSGFAILAHPYAPLGGCYDDPIVQTLGSIVLQTGFVLCTFNFRGAMNSAGSTSWTGRPELADYVSVYAFMLHLMSCSEMSEYTLAHNQTPLFLLGGYSYGSMIASHLPDIETVKATCMSFEKGSPDHEIRLRALEIVKVLLGFLETEKFRASRDSRTDDHSGHSDPRQEIRMGGRESESSRSRSRANSSRGSIDTERIRRSFDRVKHKISSKSASGDLDQRQTGDNTEANNHVQAIVTPRIAYLLISPLLQPFAGFTTIFSQLVFERTKRTGPSRVTRSLTENLSRNPTLAVYGDKDIFTSARRLRKWTRELQGIPNSQFNTSEIAGAGHFWHEHNVLEQMSKNVREWVTSLVDEDLNS